MTKLRELWNAYSSQEPCGESLHEADHVSFDELDAAITSIDEREKLVQEVIRLSKARDEVSPYARKNKLYHASLLQVAARKLAEWSP